MSVAAWSHVGPTLFWTRQKPEIGQDFSTAVGRFTVERVAASDGGWLVFVRIAA